uniref:Uncharacterized protein n=1 Tax=Salix viminalis TaxID=40686 RepID=A0A6N2M1Q5_SALVM
MAMEINCLFDILDHQVVKQGKEEDVLMVASLARSCLRLNGKERPTMKEVTMVLERIQKSENLIVQREIEYDKKEVMGAARDVTSPSTVSSFGIMTGWSVDADERLAFYYCRVKKVEVVLYYGSSIGNGLAAATGGHDRASGVEEKLPVLRGMMVVLFGIELPNSGVPVVSVVWLRRKASNRYFRKLWFNCYFRWDPQLQNCDPFFYHRVWLCGKLQRKKPPQSQTPMKWFRISLGP